MKTDNLNEKTILIQELLNSGINVTPSILDFLLNLDDPLKIIKSIIKDISFLPNFNSHLTLDVLQKISNEELQKELQKVLIKEINSKAIQKKKVKEDENSELTSSLNIIVPKNLKSKSLNSSLDDVQLEKQLVPQEDFLILNKFKEETPKVAMKSNSGVNPFERSKSTLRFKPIAKEFNSNFKILKDPTGKLYTNGDYENFYNLTLDKFNSLRKLIRKRPEVLSANNINNILRLTNKVEVSVIGMVNEVRKTKNQNFFLILEDLTGSINIIVRKDSENQENVKLTNRIINDQMIYVEGTYNPGEKGKGGVIYCNYISKIDIPKDNEPNKSTDPLSIVLISDTHIGSKEFEEKLWNRFINFLNGKIGNKHQRDRASRIKYIIINGDLVDGIGVYPTQKEDLIISDIYKQFEEAAKVLSRIPDHIQIFYSSGNHEPVRNAIPRPSVPKKYSLELINQGVICVGNPSLIQTHNVNTLVFHGDSLIDLNMLIPGLENNKPVETMKELLICRHLAPIYGKKTQIAPTDKDWLVIDKIPDIFHTGHIHINDMGSYSNILLTNSGCFQSQTEFMNSLGIKPTPGILSIVDLDTLKGTQLDLKSSV
ncbi:MAG: DNA-directed DNA polymerase II small subunit [Candidatus Lokiarchaeota archaeon]|nr:DNA-directed DNA polymerase II small subunit [Candidatus Lokiarchaeota archaeon]